MNAEVLGRTEPVRAEQSADYVYTKPTDELLVATSLATASTHEVLEQTIIRFDQGITSVRDIADFTTRNRQRVLDITRAGQTRMPREDYALFTGATETLAEYMKPNADVGQPLRSLRGWRFLHEAAYHLQSDPATGLESNKEWAHRLNSLFVKEFEHGIGTIATHYLNNPDKRHKADQLVKVVASNPRYAYNIGQYLAEQSLSAEHRQERQYGRMLVGAKANVIMQLGSIGAATGLDPSHIRRARDQVLRTCFGANNRFVGTDPTTNQVALGEYLPYTLRINVMHDEADSLGFGHLNPDDTIEHEVRHASSAQARAMADDGYGNTEMHETIGLRANNRYTTGNEGMTEFLSQLGKFGAERLAEISEGAPFPTKGNTYNAGTRAMAKLWHRRAPLFGHLYNAYHGQVDDVRDLTYAMAEFTSIME